MSFVNFLQILYQELPDVSVLSYEHSRTLLFFGFYII